MLWLKRMQYFNEFRTCDASGQVLMYGDFYYQDDETGKVISADYYNSLKKERQEAELDYMSRDYCESYQRYQQSLLEKEHELLSNKVLDIPRYGKEEYTEEKKRR